LAYEIYEFTELYNVKQINNNKLKIIKSASPINAI
jgi:hypothetical protein